MLISVMIPCRLQATLTPLTLGLVQAGVCARAAESLAGAAQDLVAQDRRLQRPQAVLVLLCSRL